MEWPFLTPPILRALAIAVDQINDSNFSDLEIAWRIKTDNFGDRRSTSSKAGAPPLMVNGLFVRHLRDRARYVIRDGTLPRLNCRDPRRA